MTRTSMDADPAFRTTRDDGVAGLGLFEGTTSLDAAQLRERLLTIARELAQRAGASGVTISDVRVTASNRGLMTEAESKSRIAALKLGDLLRDAGLFPTGRYRRSSVGRSHGNLHGVFVLEEFAPVDARKEA